MQNYTELKKAALEKYFNKMNPQQQKAIFSVNGPVLVLSGAGSGKTTVIVNRIANMITFGNAYFDNSVTSCTDGDADFLKKYINGETDDLNRLRSIVKVSPVKSWNILAITFTNKAANELKTRLSNMLGEDGLNVHASTFHSACARILRQDIERLGYSSNFTIYDSDDSLKLMKSCISDLGISDKMFPPKTVINEISNAKDKILSPLLYEQEASAEGDYRKITIAKAYKEYQKRLKSANALDFDDMIFLTIELLRNNPDILEKYRNKYKYIMVDEYQDTNMAQFELVRLLSQSHNNLCVVGDDDQSIYKFRGATIENILGFDKKFDNCKVIRLEQNYRSTQNILDAANSIIKNNNGRKEKTLWSELGNGNKITVYNSENEHDEASFIASKIMFDVKNGGKYSDHAILYRMNVQSNVIERIFSANAIPYTVFGGLRFFDRKEIKDMIAYLSVINNHNDMQRLKRIINEPKRGIGNATVSAVQQTALENFISPVEAMKNAENYKSLSKKKTVLSSIGRFFELMSEISSQVPLENLLDMVLEKSGYGEYLKSLGVEGDERLEHISELKSSMADYTERFGEFATLSGFLEEISLYTDMDRYNDSDDRVVMMTIHSAKGLEFPNVYIAGMEEGIFPGTRSMSSDDDIEEERRLAYVAVTRAKKQLCISYTSQRMIFGTTTRNLPSRFLDEIPDDIIDKENKKHSDRNSFTDKTSSSENYLNKSDVFKSEPAPKNESYFVGDKVIHNLFGEGTVLSVLPMANDNLLEIKFDKAGNKKIMANFARLQKI